MPSGVAGLGLRSTSMAGGGGWRPRRWLAAALALAGAAAFAAGQDARAGAAGGVASPYVGPSQNVFDCQRKVQLDYTGDPPSSAMFSRAQDQPQWIDVEKARIEENLSDQGDVFQGVDLAVLDPAEWPEAFPAWTCDTNAPENVPPGPCGDDSGDVPGAPPRGTALLFVPKDVKPNAPRLLYIHGGSWLSGSPWTQGYPTFCAKLAKFLGMPVLSIDYALIPTGMFNVGDHPVLPAVAKATKFLAAQSPRRLVDTKGKRTSQVGDKRRLTKTKIFIMGDSSGAGTAISALAAQAARDPGWQAIVGRAKIKGGVLISPWTNLMSNSPTYLNNLYNKWRPGGYGLGDVAFGCEEPEDPSDVCLPLAPPPGEDLSSSRSAVLDWTNNAKQYVGDDPPGSCPSGPDWDTICNPNLKNPLANPLFAPAEVLKRMAPMSFHVGTAELMYSDSAMLANKVSASGGKTEFHTYDGMWHVWPMASEGCGTGVPLLMGQAAFASARTFLQGLVKKGKKGMKCGRRAPCFFGHWEYPKGQDSAEGMSAFA